MLINTFHAAHGHTSHVAVVKSCRLPRLFTQLTSGAGSSPPTPKVETSLLGSFRSLSEESPSLVVRSTSNNPYHNLAIEDYLLRNSAHTSHVLFFYANRPCVVIGRNQNPWLECNLRLIQQGLPIGDRKVTEGSLDDATEVKINIDLVRRRSGGGTVFHDEGNLNYSVIAPNSMSWKRAKHAQMVVRALNSMQDREFEAEMTVNDRNDIVMKRHGESEWLKISGSAYKLIRGRALHHGTLLYSSPYLKSISELLRSPGKEMIRAKGVESVRSKVGNLQWMEELGKREELKESIIEAIAREFNTLYGSEGPLLEVGDSDVDAPANKEIKAGALEMMSDEWRFEQTPRFDFESAAEETNGPERIAFGANRGMVESFSLLARDEDEGEEVFASPQVHLHRVRDWQDTLKQVMGNKDALWGSWRSETLMQQLEVVFPPWRDTNA